MKKLQGMKSGFSSLENKKLKNLKSISGGFGSSRNAPSQYPTSQGQVYDTDFYTDDNTAGTWDYKSRTSVFVGEVIRNDN